MKRILVTGSNGQLGQCFAALAKKWPTLEFHFCHKAQANITNAEQMQRLIDKIQPTIIINCAAYCQVDLAEQNHALAYAVNATAVKQLAKLCKNAGIFLVHFSTDYVFSGATTKHCFEQAALLQPYSETATALPINYYGLSKLAGEQAMLDIAPMGLVLRTSWLYSQFGPNFVTSISHKLQQGQALNIVDDQIGSPTYGPELAAACLQILTKHNLAKDFTTAKLLHLAGQGQASWYQLALQIQQLQFKYQQPLAGYNQKQHKQQTGTISAISSQQWPSLAKRPAYSALSSAKLKQLTGISLPPWQQSIAKCIKKSI